MTGTKSVWKNRLRDLLGENSLEWRMLHGVRLSLQRVRPPAMEPSISIEQWEEAGRPSPPPHAVKERILEAYASALGIGTLIETGTYLGNMVWAMKDRFDSIVSIELSERLARRARRRFRAFPHIRILEGDSAKVLRDVLAGSTSPCLFWLDSHYSSGITARGEAATPVIWEMDAILNHNVQQHGILIDDARLFTGSGGFPNLEELRELVWFRRPGWGFSVRSDVIRVHPGPAVVSDF